ncbi:hypothetical protein ABS71_14540 [bacterium SCN 62-11]|nr:DUF4919 domain-containing protein [Candidatus Eremiobacteraeota bacterium]ODT63253.1 MAG: hypothetical protein ABS71_14540 [bacterium SCN 62-11]
MRLFLVFLMASAVWAQDYETLLRQARKGDPATDFTALRAAYTRRPGYNGYETPPQLAPMLKALASSDWAEAEKQAAPLAISNYLQLDAHYVLLLISKRRGDATGEKQHDFMLRGLSSAIRAGHDGSSPEQAWKALSVAEEFSVCRLAGWRLKSQDRVHQGAREFDRVMVTNADGKTFPIYFDITDWFGKL